jgi:hypothetical protein
MRGKHLVKLFGLSALVIVAIMAVNASATRAAQWQILLNGANVSSITLDLKALASHMTAENGLEVACEGGTGELTGTKNGTPSGDGLATNSVKGSAAVTFEECVWVGSEASCTINDGGAGLINATGNGEAIMNEAGETLVTASSSQFTTIFTEGVFCTIPEEEEVSGGAHLLLLGAAADTVDKLSHLLPLGLKIGNSSVTELEGEGHITDAGNPSATWAIELV